MSLTARSSGAVVVSQLQLDNLVVQDSVGDQKRKSQLS